MVQGPSAPPPLPPLAVTTSGQGGEADRLRARRAADRLGVELVERRRKAPLGPLIGQVAEALLVFGGEGVMLWDRQGRTRFQEGMAALRKRRLAQGDRRDHLVRAAGFHEGETVLDCTLGLAQDALVAALAVGPRGRVVGVEKSLALHALVSEGLTELPPDERSCPVECVLDDSRRYLRGCAAGAFDVVLIDPMFQRARKAQPAFDLLRRHADHSPLTAEMLAEARRVARRVVVVKGARYTGELRRLGLTPEPFSRFADVDFARASPIP